MVVIKRCVDVHDLIASAGTGQADVAVVAGELGGLDADAVMRLLATTSAASPWAGPHQPSTGSACWSSCRSTSSAGCPKPSRPPAPVTWSWIPTRTTRRSPTSTGRPAGSSPSTDPPAHRDAPRSRSGSPPSTPIAAAGPCSSTPTLTEARSPSTWRPRRGLRPARRRPPGQRRAPSTPRPSPRCRRVVDDGFEVLTGLPRPDRWVEARPGVLDAVLERAAEVGDVVVDTGFSLEDDADLGRHLSRNQLTLDAVAAADQVVVVGLRRADRTGAAGPQPGRGPRHARRRR